MLIGYFWLQAFDLAQQTALCWRPPLGCKGQAVA